MAWRNLIRWSQFLLVLCASSASAGPLFDDDAMLDIELRGPLSTTIRDSDAREQRRFQLTVGVTTLDVAVRIRGNNRVDECRFPPLRLNFRKGDTEGTVFEGQDKLKLVTHCMRKESFEQNVLDEYLAYRIFNLLSSVSHRARLLRIRYVDEEAQSGEEPITRLAFVIDSDKHVAARNDGEAIDLTLVRKSQLDLRQSALVFVFHYLIANRDWSFGRSGEEEFCCHNGKLIDIDGRLHVVPYDFDRSGLVGVRYAMRKVSRRAARTRIYQGYCMPDLDLETAVAAVVEHEQDIMDLVATLPGATDRETRIREKFLQEFFDRASDPSRLAGALEKRCVD